MDGWLQEEIGGCVSDIISDTLLQDLGYQSTLEHALMCLRKPIIEKNQGKFMEFLSR